MQKITLDKINKFASNIEILKKLSFILVLIIITSYGISQIHQLSTDESGHDYESVLYSVKHWDVSKITHFDLHVTYLLLSISDHLGNIKVLPFLSTVSLLILTYLFTKEITGKRFFGLVSLVVIAQSNILFVYGSLATYSTFWITFYLASLYLITKKYWYLSPIFFLLGTDCKPLVIAYIPISLYWIHLFQINRSTKKILYVMYGIIILVIITSSIIGVNPYLHSIIQFKPQMILTNGLDWWMFLMLYDMPLAICYVPLIVSLFKSNGQYTKSLASIIIGMSLVSLLLSTFTVMYNEPYRLVSLITFISIGTGVLFTHRVVTR